MPEKKELRAYNFEIRASEDNEHGCYITGVPIVYDQRTDLGYFDEIIARGALDKTNLKDVRFLVNHDTNKLPLARSRNNNANSTMQMEVLDEGMHIRVNLDTENNAEARSLYSAIQRGDITGMSFMFAVRGEKWDDLESDHPVRTITDIETVYEVSAVTFPAYEQTSIQARSKETLDNVKSSLDSEKAKEEERKNSLDSELRDIELQLLEVGA